MVMVGRDRRARLKPTNAAGLAAPPYLILIYEMSSKPTHSIPRSEKFVATVCRPV